MTTSKSRSTSTADNLELGRVARAHGLKGEVELDLVTNRQERVAPGARLLIGDRWVEVEASRPNKQRWLVRLAGVDDREGAEALRGQLIFGEPLADPDALWVHDLIGSVVFDTDGAEQGTVEAVQANPAADLLVLDTGPLVPLTFVVAAADGRIVVDGPDGLFDV